MGRGAGKTRNLFAEDRAREDQKRIDDRKRAAHLAIAKALREHADLIESATDLKRLSVTEFELTNNLGERLKGTKAITKYDTDGFAVSMRLGISVSRAVYTVMERNLIGEVTNEQKRAEEINNEPRERDEQY